MVKFVIHRKQIHIKIGPQMNGNTMVNHELRR